MIKQYTPTPHGQHLCALFVRFIWPQALRLAFSVCPFLILFDALGASLVINL